MKKFDVIVVGSGAGLEIASFAAEHNSSVALIEEGPLGGTCLNRGCIPSKMLIHSADVAETIKESAKFGIKSKIESIDFSSIVKRVSEAVDTDSSGIEQAVRKSGNPVLYKVRSKFIGSKQMQAGSEQIEADKVFIVGGTRPSTPPIPGIKDTPYLDSTKALRLEKQPEHLVIIGGGYIAAELAHFFGALGTKITILVRGKRMLDNEDEEIADWFTKEFSKKYEVLFNTEVEAVSYQDSKFTIKLKSDGRKLEADQLLVATGRVSNTDILDVKATGVEIDEKGYIKVNDYLETNIEGIWAFGDIIGILPFRHAANDQVGFAIRNAFTDKVLVDEQNNILGVHIIGPNASILIHEAIVAMKANGKTTAITDSVYIHPALPEWLQRAFFAIE
ncbi:MAG: FAD-dependent oxidoreductase [Candidatus Levybacteria bacterium]|nr:FAD-dependent oxidoreductase [Candidatus Levybacteria bacterium]